MKETTEEAVEKGAFGSPTMLFTKGYVILNRLRLKLKNLLPLSLLAAYTSPIPFEYKK